MSQTPLRLFLSVLLLSTVTGAWAQDHSKLVNPEVRPIQKLIGIVEGDPEGARAIFENIQTKEQKLYRIGDSIDGAILIEIKRREILLRRGQEITAVLVAGGSPDERKIDEKNPNQKKLSGIPVPVGVSDPRQAISQVLSQQVAPYESQVVKKPVPRSTISQFVDGFQKQMADPALFAKTSLGPALSMEHVDPEVLNSLGLKPTDMIVGVSGMSLDSPERLGEIFGILGRAKVSNLSVFRGNVVEPLAYEVQQ